MQINLKFDSSVANASANWVNAIKHAASLFDNIIKDPITVTFDVGFGEIGGQALPANAGGVTSPTMESVSYSSVVSGLVNHANTYGASPLDQSFLSNLPKTDPNGGQPYEMAEAQAKVLGLLPANYSNGAPDAYLGFGTSSFWYDPNRAGIPGDSYDLIGTAIHELAHGLGRDEAAGVVTPMNLFSYNSSTGNLDMNAADTRYISYDGGRTDVANLDTTSDASDWAQGSPTNDPFDASATSGVDDVWTYADTATMEMLGYDVQTPTATSSAQLASVSKSLSAMGLSISDFSLDALANLPTSGGGGYSETPYQPNYAFAGLSSADPASFVPSGNGGNSWREH
jgi:hypothetical protein